MVTNQNSIRLIRLLLLTVVAVSPTIANAQTPGDDWARWWYGAYLGVNVNLFNGTLHNLGVNDINVANPTGFDGGSGLGLGLGGLLEYNSGDLLGGNVFIGYDNRHINFDTKNTTRDTLTRRMNEELSTSLAYITVEPNLRLNLMNRFFHVMIGPSFAINLSNGYDYSFIDTANVGVTRTSDLANVRSFVVGGQLGLGYDLVVKGPKASPQILATPFVQFRLGQDLLDPPAGSTDDYGANTIRVGLQVKFGTPGVPPIDTGDNHHAGGFSVRAPNVVTSSRRLQETFPLRNYVFFDAGSTNLPERYKQLSSSEASTFREDQLIRGGAETGRNDPMMVRSRRQMEVYYNVLNIFADRMRRNPAAKITLSGAANGDADAGKKMAQNVKDYLVSRFGIDAGRITVEGKAMPTHRSGSGASGGEDRKLLDAENYRVEISAQPQDLLQPVSIISMQDELIDNDIVLTVPNDEKIASWRAEITERGGAPQMFGPFTNRNIARIDSKTLLGSRNEGRYTARAVILWKDGKETTSNAEDFRLVRSDDEEEESGTRYSILFEFDESKTVETYRDFLAKIVAPAIPDGASVIIHGHTDVSGEPDYNAKLSQKRCDAAREILQAELDRLGRKATFDSYGFGEDERRSPFNNALPEQRYYNRTVVIEVVPGR